MIAGRRWRYWLRSLRFRAFVVAVIVAVAPMSVVAIVGTLEIRSEPEMQRSATAAVSEVVEALREDSDAIEHPEAHIRRAARRHHVRLRLIDASGQLVADADESRTVSAIESLFFGPEDEPALHHADAQQPPIEQRPVAVASLATGFASECETWAEGTLRVCQVATRLQRHGDTIGLIYAQQAHRRTIRALYDLRFALLKLTLFVAAGALGLGWWLGWRMVRPLHRLRAQALQRIERSSAAPLDLRRDDEIGDLATAFNRLLAALQDRAQQNEAFVADLAHEFKNPVAAIRACAESLADPSTERPTSPERQARLARVLNESSVRLDALVTQFLELARAEAGMVGEDREPFEFGALVRGVVESIAAQEEYQGVSIEADVHDIRIHGVSGSIETAVRNLVHNAASFAGEGGHVRVELTEDGEFARLQVHDNGPGIAKDDVPLVFDRFFTRRTGRTGTGLGLALVQAIATAHGGRADVQSVVGEGSTFSIRVPLGPKRS